MQYKPIKICRANRQRDIAFIQQRSVGSTELDCLFNGKAYVNR
jgi:hypothetical protein